MAGFQKFHDWYQNRHEYAKEWKATTGGKVLGYFCTYVPEELLYAAGILLATSEGLRDIPWLLLTMR